MKKGSYLLKCQYLARKVSVCVFAIFYDFQFESWNCSNSVVIFLCFHFMEPNKKNFSHFIPIMRKETKCISSWLQSTPWKTQ